MGVRDAEISNEKVPLIRSSTRGTDEKEDGGGGDVTEGEYGATDHPMAKNGDVSMWKEVSYSIKSNVLLYSLEDKPSDDRGSSALQMGINLESMILGTSVVSLPYCVKTTGVYGIVAMVVVGVICGFNSELLADCQYQESQTTLGFRKRVIVSFVDIAKACWKKGGFHISKAFVYLGLMRNVVIIVLLTDTGESILHNLGVKVPDKKLISVFWTLMTIPLLFITKISLLVWISFIGLILYLGAIFAVLVICVLNYRSWNASKIPQHFDFQSFGISLGIIINSYAFHMNMPALEASLKNPEDFPKASRIGFFINIAIKTSFGVCGYLTYLGDTQQEIMNNVYQYYPLPIVLQASVMFYSYFTLPLQCFAAMELIDQFQSLSPMCSNHKYVWLLVSRCLLMTSCLMLAILIPQFSVAVGLVGSLTGSMIGITLPALFYVTLKTHRQTRFKKIMSYGIAVFGVASAAAGVYCAVSATVLGLKK